jgi:hypothetical protein
MPKPMKIRARDLLAAERLHRIAKEETTRPCIA